METVDYDLENEMGQPIKDLKNQRFTKLLVLVSTRKRDKLNGSVVWKCRCDCGRMKLLSGRELKAGRQSCGCLQGGGNKLGLGEATGNLVFRLYCLRAKRKGLVWDISKAKFFLLTKGRCYYCGVEPSQVYNIAKHNGAFVYNGVDRLDNKKGYTKKNCVSCCGVCNRAKDIRSEKDFLSWVKRIYDFRTRLGA